MTNQRTNHFNAFTTELTAPMGSTDLAASVSTIGPLVSPVWAVIEPDSPTQREYVLFDGAFSAGVLRTAALSNRYAAGSAAGAGLTHPTGSKVRISAQAQHFEDLHDRVDAVAADVTDAEADIASHDHDGINSAAVSYDDLTDVPTLEVEAVTLATEAFAPSASFQLVASVDLAIPTTWTTWSCFVMATLRVDPIAENIVLRADIDGVVQHTQYVPAAQGNLGPTLAYSAFEDTGLGQTGTRTVTLEVLTDDYGVFRDISLYARARKLT